MTSEFNATGSKLPRVVLKETGLEAPDMEKMREQLWDKNAGGLGQMWKVMKDPSGAVEGSFTTKRFFVASCEFLLGIYSMDQLNTQKFHYIS